MCEDNCVLRVNPSTQGVVNILTLQDNDDSALENVDTIAGGTGDAGTDAEANEARDWRTVDDQLESFVPVTVTEQGPNSGVFGTYDESDNSAIIITTDAARGNSATFDYNETPTTVLVGFDFATVDIQPIKP
eukprot:UN11467